MKHVTATIIVGVGLAGSIASASLMGKPEEIIVEKPSQTIDYTKCGSIVGQLVKKEEIRLSFFYCPDFVIPKIDIDKYLGTRIQKQEAVKQSIITATGYSPEIVLDELGNPVNIIFTN